MSSSRVSMGSEGSFGRRLVVRDRHLRRSPTRFRWSHGVGNFSGQSWGDSPERHHPLVGGRELLIHQLIVEELAAQLARLSPIVGLTVLHGLGRLLIGHAHSQSPWIGDPPLTQTI